MTTNKFRWPLLLIVLCGCGSESKSGGKNAEPSKVEKVPETFLNRIVLTEQAEKRLGITYGQVERQEVPNERTFSGLVVIPTGNSAIVSAPVTGTIELAGNSPFPVPGVAVAQDSPLFTLKPILPPERFIPTQVEQAQMASAQAALISARLLAEGEIQRSRAEVDVAKKAYDRAKEVLASGAGSQRNVEEAEGRLIIAQKALAVAQDRLRQLSLLQIDPKHDSIKPIALNAPIHGVVQNVTVRPGLMVTAGTPLLEVARLDKLWIRVGLYSGFQELVLPEAPARVTVLAESSDSPSRQLTATRVQAPPSADPNAVTVDLYYEVDDPEHLLHPQERVAVTLVLNRQLTVETDPADSPRTDGRLEALTVPQAAVLYDINGNTWVYRKAGPQTFERARVEVAFQFEQWTVLRRGPEPGTEIVVEGAAELFGTEFGAGK